MAFALPLKIFLIYFLYFVAYCLQPILSDVIKLNGAANSSTFLILLPHYYSMIFTVFIPTKKKLSECNWRRGLFVSCLDILNQLLKKGGLVFSGAAAYTVVDSSSIIWTAVWSRVLLQRNISKPQWISLFVITIGLSLKALQLNFSLHDEEFFGVLLIFIASILMGLTFVLNEKFMKDENYIEGPNIVCMMGTICSIVLTIWTAVWTVPQFDQLITANIKKKNGDYRVIIASFLCLFIAGCVHSGTFWYIMQEIGATSSGVLKGAKVATVFLVSHLLFCEVQPSQCLTIWTGSSAIVSMLGVILYGLATSKEADQKKTDVEKLPLISNDNSKLQFENDGTDSSTAVTSPYIRSPE